MIKCHCLTNIALHFIRAKSNLIVSRPDEVNYNIHETWAFNPPSATGVFNVIVDILIINSDSKFFSKFKSVKGK